VCCCFLVAAYVLRDGDKNFQSLSYPAGESDKEAAAAPKSKARAVVVPLQSRPPNPAQSHGRASKDLYLIQLGSQLAGAAATPKPRPRAVTVAVAAQSWATKPRLATAVPPPAARPLAQDLACPAYLVPDAVSSQVEAPSKQS
jgi:hypothetical protein